MCVRVRVCILCSLVLEYVSVCVCVCVPPRARVLCVSRSSPRLIAGVLGAHPDQAVDDEDGSLADVLYAVSQASLELFQGGLRQALGQQAAHCPPDEVGKTFSAIVDSVRDQDHRALTNELYHLRNYCRTYGAR